MKHPIYLTRQEQVVLTKGLLDLMNLNLEEASSVGESRMSGIEQQITDAETDNE